VNCTACIDACDEVMVKLERPKGLIRYASQKMIEEKQPFHFTTRMKAYSGVLALLLGILFTSLAMRSDMEATILRAPGMLYQEVDEATVSNLYTFQIVNKTIKDLPIELKLKDEVGEVKLVGKKTLSVQKQGIIKGAFFVNIKKKNITNRKMPLVVEIWSDGEIIDRAKTNFNYK
jgi:polyferredoxin